MRRFVIFPLGLCGSFLQWRLLSLAEFLVILWPDYSARHPRSSLSETYLEFLFFQEEPRNVVLQTALPGLVLGLLWAALDFRRNRRHDEKSVQFARNLLWLNLYATLLIASNGALIFGILSYYARINHKAPALFTAVVVCFCFFVNLCCGIIAIVRTLTTPQVLHPRLLWAKLRERSRLG